MCIRECPSNVYFICRLCYDPPHYTLGNLPPSYAKNLDKPLLSPLWSAGFRYSDPCKPAHLLFAIAVAIVAVVVTVVGAAAVAVAVGIAIALIA